jgi:hypothetical protein
MHPAAAQHGNEEMATALAEAAEIESTIDSGERFGDARFRFADEAASAVHRGGRELCLDAGRRGVTLSGSAALRQTAERRARRGSFACSVLQRCEHEGKASRVSVVPALDALLAALRVRGYGIVSVSTLEGLQC